MSSTRRPLAALALAVLISLVLAGCSSGAADPETGKSNATTVRDEAVKFATCMRDHGVTDFPDPDASGTLTLDGVVNGSSVNPDGPAWKKAISACKRLQPAGFTGKKRNARAQSAALEFAQCVRDHGVRDFPDPAEGEPLVNTNKIPSTDKSGGMDILNAAMHTCGELYSGKLGLTGP
jgi:hypothetical protein